MLENRSVLKSIEDLENVKSLENVESVLSIVQFYSDNVGYVNNWDLVDMSAPKILGHFCYYENYYVDRCGDLGERYSQIAHIGQNKDSDYDVSGNEKTGNEKTGNEKFGNKNSESEKPESGVEYKKVGEVAYGNDNYAENNKNNSIDDRWNKIRIENKIENDKLLSKSVRCLLDEYAKSHELWKNRIAVVSTLYLINNGYFDLTIKFAKKLMHQA